MQRPTIFYRASRRALPGIFALAVAATPVAGLVAVPAAHAQTPAQCQYVLGFANLHNAIPNAAGDCAGNLQHMANGDARQMTANGVLIWRKGSNFTGFSNGADVFYAAPGGVASVVSGDAANLRATLSDLLAEHVYLALVAMQKGYDGAPDFQAAAAELDDNSVALSEAIASVYGDAAGQQFLALWRDHIRMFVDYTTATAAGDEAGRAAALRELSGYAQTFADFLAGANPNLPSETLQSALNAHVNQLTAALDRYAAGDYAATYNAWHAAYEHMFMTGGALAGAIAQQFPEQFPGDSQTPAADLRLTLDHLLSEHANLAVVAMQKGYNGAPDFEALAAQLDENSVALSEAIGSVYGPDAAKAFLAQWRAHIGMFVKYTQGTATNNEALRQEALNELAGYRRTFANFLAGANPNLPSDAVAGLLQEHVNQLTGTLDQYAAGNYAPAYEAAHEAHHHMFMTGKGLAGAIVMQFPENFVQ